MLAINTPDPELDEGAVFAEHDRIMAEAAHDALAQARNRATRNPDGLIYRTQENARCASAAVYEHVSDGNDNYDAKALEEIDPHTMQLLEAIGDALGVTRIELHREFHAADAKLLERIGGLERELKNVQARTAELEHQLQTLTETRITTLEKHTKLVVGALPRKSARISELEAKVKALNEAIGGESSARDLHSRLGYIEGLMSTIFPMAARSQV